MSHDRLREDEKKSIVGEWARDRKGEGERKEEGGGRNTCALVFPAFMVLTT